MKDTEHQELVKNLAKSGEDIIKDLTPEALCNLSNSIWLARGYLSSLDLAKKAAFYNQQLGPQIKFSEPAQKEFAARVKDLTPRQANLLHMGVGIVTEALELLESIDEHIHGYKLLDILHIIEEMGDLEFYQEGLRQELELSRQEILAANISKLTLRYPKRTFSNEDAQNRADKIVQHS